MSSILLDTARNLQPQLKPGQRLVARQGRRRWDGFVVTADAETPTAIRLQQKNRLVELERLLLKTESAANIAASARQPPGNHSAALERPTARHAKQFALLSPLEAEAVGHSILFRKLWRSNLKLLLLDAKAAQTAADIEEAPGPGSRCRNRRLQRPIPQRRARMPRCNGPFLPRRGQFLPKSAWPAIVCRPRRNPRRRRPRRHCPMRVTPGAAAPKKPSANKMISRTVAEIPGRSGCFGASPSRRLIKQRDHLLTLSEKAETHRRETADNLARAETALAQADRALRDAETTLSGCPRTSGPFRGAVGTGTRIVNGITARIQERLQIEPDAILTAMELTEDDLKKTAKPWMHAWGQLERERENIGP